MFSKKRKNSRIYTEKTKKFKSSPISLLKNNENFPKAIFAQHLYVSVEYQVIYQKWVFCKMHNIEIEVYIVSYKEMLGFFICS
jgi:hypothetical protein